MRTQRKRIFISDLPEAATQVDIETVFKKFGTVISVEIKKRKEILKKNSLHFAYIDIEIDDRNLQHCFQHFANTEWFGQNVVLQIARESFLDRLKREREDNEKKNTTVSAPEENPMIVQHNISNGIKQDTVGENTSSDNASYDNTSKHNDNMCYNQVSSTKKNLLLNINRKSIYRKNENIEISDVEKTPDLIVENKEKVFGNHGLKIESTDNKSAINTNKAKEKLALNTSDANLKRLQSLNNLKKNYQTQKSMIQAALSQIDSCPKNKIIFDEDIENENTDGLNSNLSKNHLFDNDQSEDEINVDFSIKEQFQGREGQKLLSLQSRYKNDKRFTLDSRFVNDDNEGIEIETNNEHDENSLAEEKKMEYQILEKILGKDVSKSKHLDTLRSQKNSMLRFDPTQPEHSKFEINNEVKIQKKRKNKFEEESPSKKKQEEKEVPEVSKETFYKVTDNLKESLHEKQEFSLLSMFSKSNDKDSVLEQNTEATPKMVVSNQFMKEKNPFQYDSSDDEEETQIVANEQKTNISINSKINNLKVDKSAHWSEPFFFKPDDYRLQEGFDFIEKMKAEENTEFSKLRRDLKEIVKAKVRNNQRKHKPFKKKLGGSKRKKMMRIKKALKR